MIHANRVFLKEIGFFFAARVPGEPGPSAGGGGGGGSWLFDLLAAAARAPDQVKGARRTRAPPANDLRHDGDHDDDDRVE